ncbi:Uncharacterised protein [Mycoplasmopsis maculosa]|uniref:Uncharacterized protein n=1 Tax=Mycoplasmopsis maculosa TaxID=114885 RepID=A0A449B4W8_9BACT|nr:hypothetical protein [Mycoplasmopsis maculosa]VEU75654.1 Uncharacterised protein [Mycoplasmopsis maculosa]
MLDTTLINNQQNNNVVHLERYKYHPRIESNMKKPSKQLSDWYGNNYNFKRLSRGAIEVKRYFNEDNFLLRIWYFEPEHVLDQHRNENVLAINKKLIDPVLVKNKTLIAKQNIGDARKIWGDRYSFNDIAESYRLPKIYYKSLTLTSQELGLKWNDIKSITYTFDTSMRQTYVGPHYWQIKRLELPATKDFEINTNSNNIKVYIPEYYKWEFSESSEIPINETIKNFEFDLSFKEWNTFDKTNKIIHIDGFSSNYEPIKWSKKNYNSTAEYDSNFETTYRIHKLNNERFNLKQSLPLYGIFDFNTNFDSMINKNLVNKQIKNIYAEGIEEREIYYDSYNHYNYKKGLLENSEFKLEKGINIPYNFYGNLIKTFVFKFYDIDNANNNDFLNLKINVSSKVDKPILDPVYGWIKLNIYEKNNIDENDIFKYVFELEDLEKLSKLEKEFDDKFLENYLEINNE